MPCEINKMKKEMGKEKKNECKFYCRLLKAMRESPEESVGIVILKNKN